MFQLAAIFSPGFEKVISNALTDIIPDAYKINISSGFVRFCTDKNPFRAVNADFLNNSFLVLKEWNNKGNPPAFEAMAKNIKIPQTILPEILSHHYKTFRLRFSRANVFTSVNKNIMSNVEKQIASQTGMKPDRLGGDTEFWFLTRTDGYACFALRMTKKQSTEKYLQKGELRPEFVTLLTVFAGLSSKSICEESYVFLDPFTGHGGIVKRLSEMFPKAKILSSEIDDELVKKIKGCIQADAANLSFVTDNSVDCVITDPPWGFWQGDLRDDNKLKNLYSGMLKEFSRIVKSGGTICVLTAAKEIFEEAFNLSDFAPLGKATSFRNDVLVNGKKAAVYVWKNQIKK
ncbi:MAG: hypothetical protein HUK25_10165 [Treponema sp.]|nr:hypothetical protein [Treponema sp.]